MITARRTGIVAIGGLLLAVAVVVSVTVGSREIPFGEAVRVLLTPGDDITTAAVQSRVPRTILGLVVGVALALAGAAMQGITRNPIAEPGILGITPGASLAVVTGIVFFGIQSAFAYTWFALVGAGVAATFVYFIGTRGTSGPTPLRLALAGAATTAALTSGIGLVLLPQAEVMQTFQRWQIGSIGGADFASLAQVAPFLLVGLIAVLASARVLNALALGDDVAAGLGNRVGMARLIAGAGSVLLSGAATALAGPIAFIGLVVPHIARLLVGSDYRWIMAFCLTWGGVLILGADTLGRVVTRPADIAVGVVATVIGAPVFIAIIRRQRLRDV